MRNCPPHAALLQQGQVFRLFHFKGDAFALVVEQQTDFGRRHAAGGTVQQPCAQARLDRRHCLGGGGLRHAGFRCRFAEAAGFHHARKKIETQKAVHA